MHLFFTSRPGGLKIRNEKRKKKCKIANILFSLPEVYTDSRKLSRLYSGDIFPGDFPDYIPSAACSSCRSDINGRGFCV